MAKEYTFNWRHRVPEQLLKGDVFDRYDDETGTLDMSCPVRFEEMGFYIVWEPKGKEAGVLDLVAVWEARPGGIIKDLRVLYELEQRGLKETIEERTVWITYGQDLVNVSSLFLIAPTAQVAREWRQLINDFLRIYKFRHTPPMITLQKHWRFLTLSTNERNKIPLRNIIRTFASGKSERMIHKCLCDLGLAGDKFMVTRRVIRGRWARSVRAFATCGTARKHKKKEREELDPPLFTFEKFLRLYHKICPRTDVQELFVKLSGQKEYLTRERLINFLNEEQRDPRLNEILFPFFEHDRVQQLIAKYETDESYIAQGKMSGDGFLRFLMSDENSPVFLDRTEMYQDMDQPLCHYYINSSHNTYLTSRQYGGKSSTEIYRQVLLSGCRCIELDCWDGNSGDSKGRPIITHGKAMCTDVDFKEALYQIRDTAFMRSDFPVILSFENHCSKSNQLKMAKYCVEVFGDMLLAKPLDDHPLEPGVPLPSPNRLKRKILIKNKRLKAEIEHHQMEQFLREGKLDEEDEMGETAEVVGEEVASPPGDQRAHPEVEGEPPVVPVSVVVQPDAAAEHTPAAGAPPSTIAPTAAVAPIAGETKPLDEAHPEKQNFMSKLKPLGFSKKPAPVLTKEEEERIFLEYNYTGATTNIHPLLSALVNYTHPIKFIGFDIAESNNLHFHMSSFSESTGLGYLKQSAVEFVNYNKRQLSRIYPKGARVDSSNFLPQIFWNAGCQMVSLNFQTPDVCMQLNQGKFDYNGQCGYLLKPEFMRRPDRAFDPFSESPVDGVIAAHCSVKVISGQFLCERKVGTYVEVEMYGLPTDTIRKEHRTKTVAANGLNPVYNEDAFVFRKVVLPELAVLRFAVYDESGKQLGQRILPLDGLQSGYRHISLRTESNMPMTLSTLFVQLVLKTYVPDELSGLVDALADPRAYLSAQEKRQEALHNMGVDDQDIVEVVPATGTNANGKQRAEPTKRPDLKNKLNGALHNSPSNELRVSSVSSPNLGNQAGLASQPLKSSGEANADNKYKVDPINLNDLRKDKSFQKLVKKLHKELEELRKRHQKQRDAIQKQQQTTVDKLMGDSQRTSKKQRQNSTSNSSRHSSISAKGSDPLQQSSPGALPSDQKMRVLVSSQTDEWSSLLKKQAAEEHEMRKQHIREEYELLKKLLAESQKQQMASLRTKFEAETKELKQNQTKKSMDDSRALQQDKNIKTKAERDRRIKELNEKNVKVFVEERKRLGMKRRRHEEKLEQKHSEQNEALEKEATKIIELETMNHQESVLAARPEAVV